MSRIRADLALFEAGHFPTQDAAARAILAGQVRLANPPTTDPLKPGTLVNRDVGFVVRGRKRYVSRGGDKLEGALRDFSYDPSGVRALDAGASTGGFTDCLLQGGASHVAAVDVGYGQLAWSLQSDPRVTVFDRTNIRTAPPEVLGGPFDLAVADLSFISLSAVLPSLVRQVWAGGDIIALVKPQFEAQGHQGDRGVVSDAAVHEEVLLGAVDAFRREGLLVRGVTYSPITGPDGNIEFWIWAGKPASTAASSPGPGDRSSGESLDTAGAVRHAVARAHQDLRGSE